MRRFVPWTHALVMAVLLWAPSGCKKDDPKPEEPSAAAESEPAPVPEGAPASRPPVSARPGAGAGAPTDALRKAPMVASGPTAPAPATAHPDPDPAATQPAASPANASPASRPSPGHAVPASQGSSPSPGARPGLPDPRLLLTVSDVSALSGGKTTFKRSILPGVAASVDYDSLYFEPEKGAAYGFGVQVFRTSDAESLRERYQAMVASYPSSTDVTPVAGKTFFAYWDEVLFVVFQQPVKNLIVVLSGGRKYCDSEKLYEFARKVAARTN